MALDKPPKSHYRTFLHNLNGEKPVNDDIEELYYHVEDIITTAKYSGKRDLIQDFLESLANRWPNSIFKVCHLPS